MSTFNPETDPVADDVAGRLITGPQPGKVARHDVVRFRGLLGPGNDPNTYCLYIHPWFHTWIELKASDIVAQHKSAEMDGERYVWVKRDVTLIYSYSATAVEHARMVDGDVDPTGIYPKH